MNIDKKKIKTYIVTRHSPNTPRAAKLTKLTRFEWYTVGCLFDRVSARCNHKVSGFFSRAYGRDEKTIQSNIAKKLNAEFAIDFIYRKSFSELPTTQQMAISSHFLISIHDPKCCNKGKVKFCL